MKAVSSLKNPAVQAARALRDAAALDPRVKGVPSTKGVL